MIPGMLTKTVFGFDQFVTTAGNTVMVFLPSQAPFSPSSSPSSFPAISSTSVTVTRTPEVLQPQEEQKLPLENMFR